MRFHTVRIVAKLDYIDIYIDKEDLWFRVITKNSHGLVQDVATCIYDIMKKKDIGEIQVDISEVYGARLYRDLCKYAFKLTPVLEDE